MGEEYCLVHYPSISFIKERRLTNFTEMFSYFWLNALSILCATTIFLLFGDHFRNESRFPGSKPL